MPRANGLQIGQDFWVQNIPLNALTAHVNYDVSLTTGSSFFWSIARERWFDGPSTTDFCHSLGGEYIYLLACWLAANSSTVYFLRPETGYVAKYDLAVASWTVINDGNPFPHLALDWHWYWWAECILYTAKNFQKLVVIQVKKWDEYWDKSTEYVMLYNLNMNNWSTYAWPESCPKKNTKMIITFGQVMLASVAYRNSTNFAVEFSRLDIEKMQCGRRIVKEMTLDKGNPEYRELTQIVEYSKL